MFDMIASTIGSVAGAGLNYLSQRETNQAMQDNMRSQMAYETNMSNTAHQREVEDLKAAGINPIYTAGGSGSSTPSVGTPNLTAPQVDLPGMIMQLKQLDQKDKEINIAQQNTDISNKVASANVANTMSETDMNKYKKILLQKGMPEAMLHGEASQVLSNMLKWIKKSFTQQPKIPVKDSSGGALHDMDSTRQYMEGGGLK